MTTIKHHYSWPEILSSREECFIPSYLRGSLKYLKEAKEYNKGWPPYPGLPTDLHTSSVAVEALRAMGDTSTDFLVAEAASYVREKYGNAAKDITVERLFDLIRVVAAEEDTTSQYAGELLDVFTGYSRAVHVGEEHYSTPIASTGLIFAARWAKDNELIGSWITLLMKMHRPESGGWSTTQSSNQDSMAATAWAVHALAIADPEASQREINGGLQYLHSQLCERGWPDICGSGGIFTAALILRAVSAAKGGDPSLTDSGVQFMRAQMNDDGGWGGENGEASGVEYTAAAVVALGESGENRFVPVRLTKETMSIFQGQIEEISAERDSLRQDFEAKIIEHCGRVKTERDTLRTDRDSLAEEARQAGSRVVDLEKELRALRSASLDVGGLWRVRYEARPALIEVVPNIGATLLLASVAIYSYVSNQGSLAFSIAVSICTALMAATSFFSLRKRLSKQNEAVRERIMMEEYLDSGVSAPPGRRHMASLLDGFRYAIEDFPPGLREELLYRLLREGVHIPTDLGGRFVRELLLDLHIPPRESQILEAWLERVMMLDSDSRRILFTQLRRVML